MKESLCQEDIFDQVYRTNAEQLRNHIYYKCGDLDSAEDIMQESFLRLWNNCKDVILESVKGFIYTVANRLFIDGFRQKKVSLKFEKAQTSHVETQDPMYVLRTEEFRTKLEETISDLPEGQREAFLLNRIEKMTYKEIAAKLEISETAVEKRMSKALLNLKAKIEEFREFKI